MKNIGMKVPGIIDLASQGSKSLITRWWLSGGIYPENCVAAYQPKGAASYATSKINLANPGTYDATEGTQPSWNINSGWSFDSVIREWLETSIILSSGWSVVCRFANVTTATDFGALFGNYVNDGDAFGIIPRHTAGGVVYYNGGASGLLVVPTLTTGVLAFSGLNCYRDGLIDGTILLGGTIPLGSLMIGRSSTDANKHITGDIYALSIYNTAITADQVSAVTTAMNTL